MGTLVLFGFIAIILGGLGIIVGVYFAAKSISTRLTTNPDPTVPRDTYTPLAYIALLFSWSMEVFPLLTYEDGSKVLNTPLAILAIGLFGLALARHRTTTQMIGLVLALLTLGYYSLGGF